jgi:hypothetical protein
VESNLAKSGIFSGSNYRMEVETFARTSSQRNLLSV